MANPFTVEPVNVLAALMAGHQGYDRGRGLSKERDQSAARQEAMTAFQGGGDMRSAIARLFGAGDVQGANAISNFGNQQFEQQFRTTESARQQGNADRSFGLQKKTAEEAARGIEYREIDDGNGGKKLVRINKATGQVEAPPVAGVQNEPTNPFAMGKMNESQSKDALYTSRMMSAEKILRDQKIVDAATSLQQKGLSNIPVLGNYAVSPEYQNYDQAKRNFINAVLRRESGAVIADSEFENADKQYFPQPGDTKERIAQKQANRVDAIRGIGAGAGQSYRPDNVFDPSGNIVANPVPAKGAGPSKQPASTAPPAAVAALRSNPSLKGQFEAKYGAGSAAMALGQ